MEKTTIQIKTPADTIKVQSMLVALLQELDDKKIFDITIQQHREKRSINANAYFHLLVHKIAEAMRIGNDECKINLNLEYGTPKRIDKNTLFAIQVPKGANVREFYDYAKWVKEIEDNGVVKDVYILYKETHTLNTAEMSRLIDGTVQEAKGLGIETLDELELKQLIKNWDNN